MFRYWCYCCRLRMNTRKRCRLKDVNSLWHFIVPIFQARAILISVQVTFPWDQLMPSGSINLLLFCQINDPPKYASSQQPTLEGCDIVVSLCDRSILTPRPLASSTMKRLFLIPTVTYVQYILYLYQCYLWFSGHKNEENPFYLGTSEVRTREGVRRSRILIWPFKTATDAERLCKLSWDC